MDDGSVVEVQLGRPIRATSGVETRCHLGLPVVVSVPPILDDGTPFPTLYWLTCPLARRRVGRLESAGGIKAMDRRAAGDPAFQSRIEEAHRRYAQKRDAMLPPGAEHRPTGGVGGTEGPGIKCLHAHLADTLSGNDNPVGELVSPWVEPLDCAAPCVIADQGTFVNNPEWQEPE